MWYILWREMKIVQQKKNDVDVDDDDDDDYYDNNDVDSVEIFEM